MGSRVWSFRSIYSIIVLLLIGAIVIGIPATATQYEGTIPSAEEDLPGALVRYVELENNDIMDWSWGSSQELDFFIMVPSDNETIVKRMDYESQGGEFTADRTATYMFAWYNDDPVHSVSLSYTIHNTQTEPIVIGILAIAVVTVLVFAYVLWFSMRGSKKEEGLGEEGKVAAPATGEPPEGPKKVAAVGIIVAIVAIGIISLAYLPHEDLDAEKGSQLILTIDNTTPDDHEVWVTTSGPGGEQVQFDKVTIKEGQMGTLRILASPEWSETGLTIELNDRTASSKDTQSWTPTQGQRDQLALTIA